MALFDRVRETTTSTGTGAITLAGAVAGLRSFSSVYVDGDSGIPYTIAAQTPGEWEVGYGTYSAGTLSRDRIVASSNAGALVSFSAGTKDVFVSPNAEYFDPQPTTTTVVVDFGETPVWSKGFTISLAGSLLLQDGGSLLKQDGGTFLLQSSSGATVGQRVMMTASAETEGDELEMDGFMAAARVTATDTVEAFIQAYPGPVTGVRRFNLLIG